MKPTQPLEIIGKWVEGAQLYSEVDRAGGSNACARFFFLPFNPPEDKGDVHITTRMPWRESTKLPARVCFRQSY